MANLASAKAITFLDIETTHLSTERSAILQICFVTDWEDGRQDVWTTKIKPKPIEIEFASEEALKICGYNSEDWSDAPSFEEVASEIAWRLAWGPLVAHNINFDLSHISAVFKRYGWKEVNRIDKHHPGKHFKVGYPVIDTCSLAYLFLPVERQNLDTLREHFNIDAVGAHDAEKDTLDCRQVFYNIVGAKLDG